MLSEFNESAIINSDKLCRIAMPVFCPGLRPRIVLGMTKLNGVAISNLSLFVYIFPFKIMFSPFLAELTQDQPSLIP